MKPILMFAFCLMGLLTFAQKNKRIYVNKGADGGSMIIEGNTPYNPGDTFVYRASANPWSFIYFGGVKGTKEKPIVVMNEGKVVLTTGLSVENSQHIKITGSGSKDKYGFHILDSKGSAISVFGKSAHIEIERFYVKNAAFGCWIKNEATCDTSINNWVLNYMSIHDFEMHNIGIEGFYMGSTDPDNWNRPINCNGVQQHHKTSRLGNVKVYNGIINGTGRPAIMLCGAFYGMSEIYNNVISNVGREYNDQQGTGISIGMYTRAYIHHNTIKNTFTWGIASLGGSGLVRIENNKIDSSGYLDGRQSPWAQNIFVDTRPTSPVDSTRFIIKNNIVKNPGSQADHIYVGNTIKSYAFAGNEVCNNGKSIKLTVRPGIRWTKCGVPQKNTASLFESVNKKKLVVAAVAGCFVIGGFIFLYTRRKKFSSRQKKYRLV